MKKLMTLIVMAVCVCTALQAQSESEARSSANYYGEGSGSGEEVARRYARTQLIEKIRPDMMKDPQFRKADQVTCGKMADQARVYTGNKGNRKTVILYIPKAELKRVYTEVTMFDELPDDGLDESGNPLEPGAEKSKTADKPVLTKEGKKEASVDNKPGQETGNKQVAATETKTEPVTTTTPKAETVATTKNTVSPSTIPANQPVTGPPAKTGNKLLDEILDAHNLFELGDFFTRGKNSGALVYGKLNTMTAPENSYLLLYNPDGTILAVYDKGSSSRRNLRTGSTENYINLFENVKIIWFQLYQ